MRKAFDNVSVLKSWADLRVIQLLTSRSDKTAHLYGWASVDVLDHFTRMSDPKVDGMDMTDIISMRYQRFEYPDLTFSDSRAECSFDIWERPGDFLDLIKDHLNYGGYNDADRQILSRIALAVNRFIIGEEAYGSDTADLIDRQLLESERTAPLTFTPGEYIPEL
ncbi:MAG: hypothetical protein ACLFP8_03585 [Alphaproteobacteria bacterium]